jgi:hypothetical protein
VPALPPGAPGPPGPDPDPGSNGAARPPGPPERAAPSSRPATPRRQTALLLTSILAVLTAILLLVFVLRLSKEPGAKVQVGSQTFNLGRATAFAPTIVMNGPLIFPPLRGDLTLYVQHLGSNPDKGWLAFDAHDPGQANNCFVHWHPASKEFVDPCDEAVFPADGQGLIQYAAQVNKSGDVIVDLRQPLATTTTTVATSSTTTVATATTTAP